MNKFLQPIIGIAIMLSSLISVAQVGIGTSAPDTTLHVVGKFKYQDGTQRFNKILTSGYDGIATWQDLNTESIFGGAFPGDFSCLGITGTLGIGTAPNMVEVSGNYAYVVDQGSYDLKVIDISNPGSVSIAGSLGVSAAPKAIDISGNFAYVVTESNDFLLVIDISNPATPSLSGSLPIGSTPIDVAVLGNYAYVVDAGSDDLKVIDVSNASSPSLITSIGLGTSPRYIVGSGDYVYVVDNGSDDLKIIDVSNPLTPSVTGSLPVGANPNSLDVDGQYAYVVDFNGSGFHVIDIGDPSSPAFVSNLPIATSPRFVEVSANYAFVANTWTNQLILINISNPSSPFIATSLSIGTAPVSIAIDDNYAFVVNDGSNDFQAIELFCQNQAALIRDPLTGELTTQSLLWQEDTVTGNITNVNAGNVGIGTLSPTRELDVNGKLRIRDLTLNNTKDSVLVATGDGTVAYREASSLSGGALGHVNWKRLNNNFTTNSSFYIFDPNSFSTSTTTSGGLSSDYTGGFTSSSGWTVPSDGIYAINIMFKSQSTSSNMYLSIRLYTEGTLIGLSHGFPGGTSGSSIVSEGGTTYLKAGDKVQFIFWDSGTGGAMNSFSATITKLM